MSEVGPPTYRLEDLKQRWEKNPSSRLYLQLAEEYRRLERLDEAVQVLEEGLERRPGDLSAWVALGRYSLEMGDVDRAEDALATAVERDPTHLVANKALLEAHLLREDAEKAGERLEIYRLLNDRDPELEHLEFRLHSLRESPEEEPAPSAAEAELEELISSAGISTSRLQEEPPAESPEEVAEASSQEAPAVDLEATHPALPSTEVAETSAPTSADSDRSGEDQMTQDKDDHPAGDLFDLGASPDAVPGFDAFWSDLPEEAGAPVAEPPAPAPPVAADAFAGFEVPEIEAAPEIEPVPEIEPPAFEAQAFAASEVETSLPGAPEMEAAGAEAIEVEEVEAEAIELEAVEAEEVELEAVEAEAVEVSATEPAPPEPAAISVPETDAYVPSAPAFDEAPAAAAEDAATAEAATAEAATEESSEDEVATVTLGSLYLKQGHLDEARRIFEKVLESDPKNHAALAGLGLARKGEKTGLTAMDLLAGRSMAGTIPAGVTAKKMLILTNYLKHLKNARERNHVR